MLIIIVTTIAYVQASYECDFLINYDHLLMMRPKERYQHVCGMP